jgi:radical SAM protein with 4Fe4S-binding SPASM domain
MVADIAKQYGAVPQFEISLTDSIEGDKCVSKYLRMTPEQLEIVLRDDNIALYVGKEAPNYGGQQKPMDENPCGAGDKSFCITPEGNLIPCCAFHALFGNIKKQHISDIIKNDKGLAYWRGLKLSGYAECGRYDYCAYCNLCPGNNFIEHGTPLKASEVNCSMAKARYNLAQKMMQGYDPLKGKSLHERLAELPDFVPMKIQREMSLNDYSNTKLKVGG